MINGGATEDEVASPSDPLDSLPPKSDGKDVSVSPASSPSRYSSCGESEFERYCSANSVMGTPSLCSSIGTFNDCLDSEFGSLRSLGLSDDSISLESFSLGGSRKLSSSSNDCVVERRIADQMRGNGGLELYDNDGRAHEASSKTMEDGRSGLKCNVGNAPSRGIVNEGSAEGVVIGYGGEEVDIVEEGVSFHRDDEGDERSLQFGLEEGEREDDGASSRYEHSEGEDSMYGYGTDDEHKGNVYFRTGAQYGQKVKAQDENPLTINTSVAFGSDDWDDFELESGGGTLASMSLGDIQRQKNDNLKPEGSLSSLTSATLIGIPSVGQTEQGNDAMDASGAGKQVLEMDQSADVIDNITVKANDFSDSTEPSQIEEERGVSLVSYQVKGADEMLENSRISSKTAISFPESYGPEKDVRDDAADKTMRLYNYSADDVFEMDQDPLAKDPFAISLKFEDSDMERKHQSVDGRKITCVDASQVSENQELGNSTAELDPLSDITMNQLCSYPMEPPEKINSDIFDDHRPNSPPSTYESDMHDKLKNNPASADLFEEGSPPVKRQNLELNDFYGDVVLEMEEILLDSSETPGSRFPQGNRVFQSQLSLPLRDGGSTASTSGTDYPYPLLSHPFRIDGVEVVGARQKKGDVSISERLVGVKEYTVYRIRVYSGKDQWEVERRYRDFYTLYRRLKSLYTDQGWILPSPWSSVEKESRKIFGNVSPDVVSERSALIQECLHSILQSRFHSSPPSALIWFLSAQGSFPSSPASNALVSGSTYFTRGPDAENISTLGKTISLIIEIRPYKSMKQMLEAQHYTCAGCHKHFDDGMTLMRDFVKTLGWGKPRLCEYTGQLFCSSCHTNETGVLPARVLHHWDFTQYPVSQLAKSYLDSIHDQPMLCVSAVNPSLFSKVPALQHVMSIRKKIGTLLPYVRCPFRRSINKGLGSRKYLLESNDFFALRDLIDLSKGPFAALPAMVETVSRKILEHITEQCLVCCDVGVACGARQACNDPSSLIFPFQEDETEKCRSCASVFHKPCFQNITSCPCGARLRTEDNVSRNPGHETSGALSLLGRRSGSGLSVGLLSGLFSKAKPENTKEHKDSDNVILMGSLPSTSL